MEYLQKGFQLLSKKQKKKFYLFFFLSFITLGFELLGIGLILPFLDIIINSEKINLYVSQIINYGLEKIDNKNLVIFFIFLFLLIYTLKVIFLTFYSYFEIKYLFDLKTQSSNELFKIYLKKDYHFHKENNSAELIRNVEDSRYIMILIRSLLRFFVEIVFFVSLVCLLGLLQPKITIIAILFFGVVSFIFFRVIQNNANIWGSKRAEYDGKKMKSILQGLGGIKEIKVLGKENLFLNHFSNNNFNSNLFSFKQDFVLNQPKNWLEWLTILCLLGLILFFFETGTKLNSIIPLLGLYALAVYKMIPSISKIMNNFQNIKFCIPAIKPFLSEFKLIKNKPEVQKEVVKKEILFNKEIILDNLSFRFENSKKDTLLDINLEIKKGSYVGISGESGAGKTTIMNLLLGLYKPTKGKILVDGIDINENLGNWQSKIGYVPQNIYFIDDSIKKNIAFGYEDNSINEKRVLESLKLSKLYNFVSSLEKNIETNIGELGDQISGGQKQRIGIARAFYNDPEILILDEFTSFLDKENEIEIAKEIREFRGEKTILMISHSKEVLDLCDNIIKIKSGNIK